MTHFSKHKTIIFLGIILAILLLPKISWAVYAIPSDRRIVWNAGLDPEGGIPDRPAGRNAVTDDGADNTGAISASTAIQNCLNNTADNSACYLPAGTYRLTTTISVPSNKSLRGAGSTTILMVYPGSGGISMSGSMTWGISRNINTTPAKDDTSLVITGIGLGLDVDDWISIYQANSGYPYMDAFETYTCDTTYEGGSVSGENCMQQFAKITSSSEAGGNTIIGLNRPLYWAYDTSHGAQIREISWAKSMVGLEDLKMDGTNNAVNHIAIRGTRHAWVKNVESYNCCNANGEAHLQTRWTHGVELRDSYFHVGQSNDSGSNYGIFAYNWNSDMKVENNIFTELRHSVVWEGGMSGAAVLYNYSDDSWQPNDPDFVDNDLISHGAHPFMNLYEGNIATKISHDSVHGSSSHHLAFRNWITAQRTSKTDAWGAWAMDVQDTSTNHTFVNNIIGMPSWTTGIVVNNGICAANSTKVAFQFGCSGSPGSYQNSNAFDTALIHGNYDYITDGVANWADADRAFVDSMYYTSKPAFFGSLTWPPFGYDIPGLTNEIPAKVRYEGGSAPPPVDTTPPAAPTGLMIQ